MGRGKKETPKMEEDLPPWEKIRTYLYGSRPEASLYAAPALIHAIHTRLQERRRGEMGRLSLMDETLAFMDSKWNGFICESPYSKKPIALAIPLHTLYAKKGGYIYRFPYAGRLTLAGDVPFLSDCTYQEYGERFLNLKVGVGGFIRETADARKVTEAYRAASLYLVRYKCLVESIVMAVLFPNVRYPSHLKNFDFRGGEAVDPLDRKIQKNLDMPRKHALMVWAYAEKDPKKLADYLHDNLLSREANRFPNDISLLAQFTALVRKNDRAMVKAITDRISKEGSEEYRMEFCPYQEYGATSGSWHSDYLVSSYHTFHSRLSDVIREAALSCVIDEIGDTWLKEL
jgi:hypothetical protein